MVLRTGFLLLLLFALLMPGSALATVSASETIWDQVAPGVEFARFELPDPNNVFVARMDRDNPMVTIDTSIAEGKLAGGREPLTQMFSRYDQALNFWGVSYTPHVWGMRNQVVVAINGSYFDMRSGATQGGLIQSGWYAKRYDNLGGWGGFTWKLDRGAFISECLYNAPEKQYLTYPATGVTQPIGDINHPPKSGELVIYTPQFDSRTGTDNSGTEVQVELTYPATIFPGPASIPGIVRTIDNDYGNNLIPFNSIVISAKGSAAHLLLDNIKIGSEVRITQEITSFDPECTSSYALGWTKSYSSIQGAFFFLKDGQIQDFNDGGAVRRNPRTAIAYDDEYVYFIVVDGRSYNSIGMTIHELGLFIRDTLGAKWAVAQDGGGSSEMVINGQVVNNPSDGGERDVANGILMVVVQPAEFSHVFNAGDPVITISDAELRLGPGTNYSAYTTVPAGTKGSIILQINGLDGVLAKSSFWWYVRFGDFTGWVPENSLATDSSRSLGSVMYRFWFHGIRGRFR